MTYELRNNYTGEVVSRHRTRKAAELAWRRQVNYNLYGIHERYTVRETKAFRRLILLQTEAES